MKLRKAPYLAFLSILVFAGVTCFAQNGTEGLLKIRIDGGKVKGRSITEILSNISSVYQIPIGLQAKNSGISSNSGIKGIDIALKDKSSRLLKRNHHR
jgi:hypothetical protein